MHAPNKYRIRSGLLRSTDDMGPNGAFRIPVGTHVLNVIASDGQGWQHVSVTHPSRIPTWEEMCIIKDLFWDEEVVCVQYHPRKSEYVNNIRNCLHIFRPTEVEVPTPPASLVGIPGLKLPDPKGARR